MCGPTGIGFLYGRLEYLNALPPTVGGGEMIDTVELEASTYAKSPSRFEAGTPPIAEAVRCTGNNLFTSQLERKCLKLIFFIE